MFPPKTLKLVSAPKKGVVAKIYCLKKKKANYFSESLYHVVLLVIWYILNKLSVKAAEVIVIDFYKKNWPACSGIYTICIQILNANILLPLKTVEVILIILGIS